MKPGTSHSGIQSFESRINSKEEVATNQRFVAKKKIIPFQVYPLNTNSYADIKLLSICISRRIASLICTLLMLMFATLYFAACQQNNRMETAAKIVAEWTGKEIRFPDGIPCQSSGRDTVCIDPHRPAAYKIMLYVDSTGCTSL